MSLNESEMKDVFEECDVDHSGYLDFDEFVSACNKIIPHEKKENIIGLFHLSDKNGDNKIDFNEFKDLVKFGLTIGEEKDPYVLLFQRCDINGDGVLEVDELYTVLKLIQPSVERQQIVELFEKFDVNKDGKLDFEEYLQLVSVVEKKKSKYY